LGLTAQDTEWKHLSTALLSATRAALGRLNGASWRREVPPNIASEFSPTQGPCWKVEAGRDGRYGLATEGRKKKNFWPSGARVFFFGVGLFGNGKEPPCRYSGYALTSTSPLLRPSGGRHSFHGCPWRATFTTPGFGVSRFTAGTRF